MDFTGKVAVVTGGASGIGEACLRAFAERNATVAWWTGMKKPVGK